MGIDLQNLLKVSFSVIASSDTGLIGDDDQQKTRIREHSSALKDARHPFKMLSVVYVGVINVDHAVTVKKSRTFHYSTVGYSSRSTFM